MSIVHPELAIDCQLVGAECSTCNTHTSELNGQTIWDFLSQHKGHAGVSILTFAVSSGELEFGRVLRISLS